MLLKKKYAVGKRDALRIFLIAAGLAASVFLPVVAMTGGYQLFFGDYQLQQIPFYSEINRALRSGELFWNWNTDMGVNVIGSYSFYLLGSPFFLITLLFPYTWTVYLMAPLYCLKLALAALGAFLFIKKFVDNKYFAFTGAILYAFSGFQLFNLVFNHFFDVVVFFPFLLLAFDALIERGKRGWLCIMVFLSGLYNYFFLPGVCIFVILYYIMRLATRDLKFSWKSLFWAGFESVVGLLMSAVILYPTLVALSDFPRANLSFGNTYDMWIFSNAKRYFEIFRGMIMPTEIPGDLNFYHRDGGSWVPNWTSTSAYLPLFSLAGVWAYLKTRQRKRDWLSIMLVFCFVVSFVPLLNSIWLLFKSNYYTRWWYMPILLMALATAVALDNPRINWKGGIRATVIAGAAISLPVGLSGLVWLITNPTNFSEFGSVGELFAGLENYPDRFWLYVFFFALSMATVILLIRFMRPIYFRDNPLLGVEREPDEKTARADEDAADATGDAASPQAEPQGQDDGSEAAHAAASSALSLPADALCGEASNDSEASDDNAIDGDEAAGDGDGEAATGDGESNRTAAPKKKKAPDFLARWSTKKRFGITVLVTTCIFTFLVWTFYEQMGYSKAFDSDFYDENYLHAYDTVQLEGTENSRLENYDGVRNLSMFMHTPGLSSFHSVVPTSTVEFYESMGIDRDVATAVPIEYGALRSLLSVRYVLDDDRQLDVFQDKSWLDYVGEAGCFDVWENNAFIPMGFCYDNAVLRSDYDSLSDNSKANIMLAAMIIEDEDMEKFTEVLSFTPFYTLSYNDLRQQDNAAARTATASSSWEFGKDSFTSVITLDKANYIFYSIPWDAGWTAYVDGVRTDIERVNVGFMAVCADAGEHTVEFRYVSPGFREGLTVTLVSASVFAVYVGGFGIAGAVRKRREKRRCSDI